MNTIEHSMYVKGQLKSEPATSSCYQIDNDRTEKESCVEAGVQCSLLFPRNIVDCDGNGAEDFDSGLQSPALARIAAATLRQTAGPRDGWRLEAAFSLEETAYRPYFRVIRITCGKWLTNEHTGESFASCPIQRTLTGQQHGVTNTTCRMGLFPRTDAL